MTLPKVLLNTLCPMHVVLCPSGEIDQAGPTLRKVCGDQPLVGARFLEVFEVYRPRFITTVEQLLRTEGRKLHLRLRGTKRVGLKAVIVPDGSGGAVVNLSFGIGVVDAVRDLDLTGTDFPPTDLAIEMLYLVEAKSAAMDASRRLNSRLQGDKLAAEERAFTDTLTGLGNRRAMDKALAQMVARGQAFSLMHLDLDFFKQVNDTLGHAAGDHVLQAAARSMTDLTRKDDVVTRVGGDEFVIICPGLIAAERIANLAERIIAQIERPVHYQNQQCEISVSIGVKTVEAEITTAEQVLAQADDALYAAKRAGRAQFRFHQIADPVASEVKTSGAPAE